MGSADRGDGGAFKLVEVGKKIRQTFHVTGDAPRRLPIKSLETAAGKRTEPFGVDNPNTPGRLDCSVRELAWAHLSQSKVVV